MPDLSSEAALARLQSISLLGISVPERRAVFRRAGKASLARGAGAHSCLSAASELRSCAADAEAPGGAERRLDQRNGIRTSLLGAKTVLFTNRQIASLVAKQVGLPMRDVYESIRRFQAAILAEVAQGRSLRVHGFATFKVLTRPARTVPGAGKRPARQVPARRCARARLTPAFRRRMEAVQTPLSSPRTKASPPSGKRPWWKVW